MEAKSENYDISFFNPTTKLAIINRNLTIKLLVIWVTAIFGFHILLRIIESPTPEPAYISFQKVWTNIQTENATVKEKQTFVKSALSVLGKLSIQTDDRMVLDKVVSSITYELVPDQSKESFLNQVYEFNTIKTEITSLSDEKYIALKEGIIKTSCFALGLNEYSIEAKLIPFELLAQNAKTIDILNVGLVEAVMSKYLIHNQSFLTDFTFLGFPFHYFYTAVFLLILFVGLCWYYCYRIDIIHEQLGIES